MKKKTIVFSVVGVVLIIALLSLSMYQANENKLHGTPLAPVESLVSAIYFNQGTYADYKSLFANKSHVISEQGFKNYKYKGQPDVMFSVDNDSIAGIMKNMKQQQINPNTMKVFWSTDPKDTAESAKVKWTIIKQNGKWYIQN